MCTQDTRQHTTLNLLAALLPLLAACSSTQEDPTQEDRRALWGAVAADGGKDGSIEDAGKLPDLHAASDANPLDQDIGFFLANLDGRMRAWNQRKLIANNPERISERLYLEETISFDVKLRLTDLVGQLQLGPVRNRRIAASAIGFSESIDAVGPLVEALSDRDTEVVSNALLGIGQLAHPETPLAPILNVLVVSSDAWARNNAAFATKRVVEAGARDDRVANACRRGLTDTEPGVRVQCALTLGILVETDAIDTIGALLEDDVALVVTAAARALAHIGTHNLHEKGRCARYLADALQNGPRSLQDRLIYEMSSMSQHNYGEDVERWREWAYNMD